MAKDFTVKESELDDIQQRVLDLTLDKSCIVTGCAGSGKSVIALHKAKRIQNERGNNYKIIVFTKALCDYMRGGKEQLGLTQPFYYHWRWRNRLNKQKADYIIVDEIQDFTKDEIQEFINATNKNFFFFGDTGQTIYDGLKETLPVEQIRSMSPSSKEFPLYYNYRLPKPVAKITQDYIGVDVDHYGDGSVYMSIENKIPFILRYANLEEQIKAISRIIKQDTLTDVGILLPNNDNVLNVSALLNREGINHEVRYNDSNNWTQSKDTLDFSTSNPKLMTYHSSKGLQFETVFLPNVIGAINDTAKKTLYVAMTRTYRYLYIMYSGNLPAPLSEVPKSLYLDTESQKLNDL
ncbi:MAG: AAA family ATPase [Clostridium sp.]|nr:AAA family ATPase [Clostridium sp.]